MYTVGKYTAALCFYNNVTKNIYKNNENTKYYCSN